ncbi:hypothetical protein AAFF_G00314960 [Aldrovandia affinis]|uniref:Uncharacterized protein n=1 Tax=Aldrovandia affinis TaxID=143900 RepID=A0AAD7R7A6_9TELE|nr:hypothetical protein AAFF_G00314960 [Aldrovandia affinis]
MQNEPSRAWTEGESAKTAGILDTLRPPRHLPKIKGLSGLGQSEPESPANHDPEHAVWPGSNEESGHTTTFYW